MDTVGKTVVRKTESRDLFHMKLMVTIGDEGTPKSSGSCVEKWRMYGALCVQCQTLYLIKESTPIIT
jgi:hypothetical protein